MSGLLGLIFEEFKSQSMEAYTVSRKSIDPKDHDKLPVDRDRFTMQPTYHLWYDGHRHITQVLVISEPQTFADKVGLYASQFVGNLISGSRVKLGYKDEVLSYNVEPRGDGTYTLGSPPTTQRKLVVL